jgi:hypothetical protein
VLTSLEQLEIESVNLSDEGISHFTSKEHDFYLKLLDLKELRLLSVPYSGNRIPTAWDIKFFRNLRPCNRCLERFVLKSEFALNILELEKLNALKLSYCGLTDRAVKKLALFTNLTSLDIGSKVMMFLFAL